MKPTAFSAFLRRAQFDGDDTGGDDAEFGAELTALVEQAEALAAAQAAVTAGNATDEQTALLADTGDEALETLITGLREGFNAARDGVTTDADVDALERVANALSSVEDVSVGRESAADDRAARVAALSSVVNSDEGGEGDGGDGAGDGTDGDGDEGDEGDGTEGGTGTEANAGGEGEGEGDGAGEGEQRQAASASAGAGRPSRSPASLNRLRRNAPAQHATSPEGEGGAGDQPRTAPMLRLVASAELGAMSPEVQAGGMFGSLDKLGQSVQRMSRAMRRHNPDPEARHYIGSIPLNHGDRTRIVASDTFVEGGDSDGALDRATDRLLELRRDAATFSQTDEGRRVVASGGTCAPAEPDYTLTLVGEAGTDFVSNQPTVGGIRPLRYFPWFEVDMTSATNRRNQFGPANGDPDNAKPDPFAATGHVTEAQDAAGYVGSTPAGPTANKTCLHITCAEPVDLDLEASYMCTTVGNFQARSFPEFVSMWDDYTRIGFDHARDTQAQAKVIASPSLKVVTGSVDFGIDVAILSSIRKLATRIRSVRRSRTLPIDVWVEDWIAEAVADSISRTMFPGGLDGLRVTGSEALAILAVTENIFVNSYRASFGTVDGRVTGVLPKQLAGAELDWPESTRIMMWPTGTVFQKTGWEIMFGLQEVGMETNDVSSFMELAENTGLRGTDIYAIDKPVCVSGVRGGSLVLDCATEDEG